MRQDGTGPRLAQFVSDGHGPPVPEGGGHQIVGARGASEGRIHIDAGARKTVREVGIGVARRIAVGDGDVRAGRIGHTRHGGPYDVVPGVHPVIGHGLLGAIGMGKAVGLVGPTRNAGGEIVGDDAVVPDGASRVCQGGDDLRIGIERLRGHLDFLGPRKADGAKRARWRIHPGNPANVASGDAVVPWLCVTVFRTVLPKNW